MWVWCQVTPQAGSTVEYVTTNVSITGHLLPPRKIPHWLLAFFVIIEPIIRIFLIIRPKSWLFTDYSWISWLFGDYQWLSMIIHDYPKKSNVNRKSSPNEVQFSIIQCKCKVNRKTLWTRSSIILIRDNRPENRKGFESCTKTAIIIDLRQITIKTKILKNRPKNHHLRSKSRSRNEVHFLIRPFLCLQ